MEWMSDTGTTTFVAANNTSFSVAKYEIFEMKGMIVYIVQAIV